MSQPKRIAYVIGSMRRGGAEGQVAELAGHFRGGAYESVLYLLQEEGDHLERIRDLGVRVRGFNFRRAHGAADPRTALLVRRTVRAMAGAMAEDRPDIVHGFLYWANVLGTWAARRAGVPRIVTSRRSLGNFKRDRRWMQWLEDRANRHAAAVTVNSEAVRRDVLARERIDPARIHLIHNGVDVDRLRTPPGEIAALRREFGAGGATKLIVCVANLIHYKRHDILLAAAKQLVESFKDFQILLVGRDGGEEAAMRSLAAATGLAGRVHFLGSRPDAHRYLDAADVVVLPSDEEGFSNVILEAMAAERAIVATRVGGTPEAITDGEEGWLVPPGDSAALAEVLRAALTDDAERARRAAAARRRAVEQFSLVAMNANYEALYASILK